MTRELFAGCAGVLADGGLVLAHVIGSLAPGGHSALVVGGAIRTFRAAGLPHVRGFPVLGPGETPASVDAGRRRNILLVAAHAPFGPETIPAAWDRLEATGLLPELPLETATSALYLLADSQRGTFTSAALPASLLDRTDPALRPLLTAVERPESRPTRAGASAPSRSRTCAASCWRRRSSRCSPGAPSSSPASRSRPS